METISGTPPSTPAFVSFDRKEISCQELLLLLCVQDALARRQHFPGLLQLPPHLLGPKGSHVAVFIRAQHSTIICPWRSNQL